MEVGVFLAVVVVGWLICGVITMLIASSKGRSTVGWFFIGFLTGIIGIILIIVLDSKKKDYRDAEPVGRRHSGIDELFEMKQKLDRGLISHAEYEDARARLMAKY